MTKRTKYVYKGGYGECIECKDKCDKRSLRCRPCTQNSPTITCPMCVEVFPREEFRTKAGNRKTYCKSCSITWFKNNRYRVKYGITTAEVEAMLKAQDHKCAICGEVWTGGNGGSLHLDHDHKTDKIRGMLCTMCNTSTGKFKDSPAVLRAAADYLERY